LTKNNTATNKGIAAIGAGGWKSGQQTKARQGHGLTMFQDKFQKKSKASPLENVHQAFF
jgi:hypothetical protein